MIYTIAFHGIDYAQVEKMSSTPGMLNLNIIKVLDTKLGSIAPGGWHALVVIRKYDDAGILLGELKYLDAQILTHEKAEKNHILSFSFMKMEQK